MPFPLIPAALSVVGSLAPSIISSIAGAKSEDEARMALKPKMDAMRAQLIGRGVPSAQVDEQVSEAFKGIIQDEMQKGALPGWAEMLLGVAGGGAGFLAGKALTKGAKTAAGAAGAATTAVKQADEGAAAITKPAQAPAKAMANDPMPQPLSREVPLESPLEEMLTPFSRPRRPALPVYQRPDDTPPLPQDLLTPFGR
jgi:hypothetical protein